MRSAKKTVKPSKTESANIARHPTKQSGIRKTETRDRKRAGQAEAKRADSAKPKKLARRESLKKVGDALISKASTRRTVKLEGQDEPKAKARAGKLIGEALAATPRGTVKKVDSGESPPKAAPAAIKSRAKSSIGPPFELPSACAAPMARAAEPCGDLTLDGSSLEPVERTSSSTTNWPSSDPGTGCGI